jgi:hypothetical protein
MSSLYYNHPFWPSPRAVRIAKLLLEQHKMPDLGWIFEQVWAASRRPKKPEGRLTHDKALKLMADYLGLTVHEFLHIKPVDAILRLKLVDPCSHNAEQKAWSILGNTTLPAWWMSGVRMPCCVCLRQATESRGPTGQQTSPTGTSEEELDEEDQEDQEELDDEDQEEEDQEEEDQEEEDQEEEDQEDEDEVDRGEGGPKIITLLTSGNFAPIVVVVAWVVFALVVFVQSLRTCASPSPV